MQILLERWLTTALRFEFGLSLLSLPLFALNFQRHFLKVNDIVCTVTFDHGVYFVYWVFPFARPVRVTCRWRATTTPNSGWRLQGCLRKAAPPLF